MAINNFTEYPVNAEATNVSPFIFPGNQKAIPNTISCQIIVI